ncbi:hypothetical protein GOB86_03770 [Acetobacter lambici]|uniref:Uncharacterized protein n=1 Tax=Acetobacter lambici TaxID=1332824 RepID=A0ABT1EXT6_9PROT|nr:hypothetical protein [Acetobacter lambici]MCP1241577.1 hypothetical protein [Acetobacter lambici]MCP1257703.1 hypothetical protein [Acetobacter lambici]NHO56200.1 hypothetical protein [Acetobacter lambici]
MQDQDVEPHAPQGNSYASMHTRARPAEESITRLDRALQRISFALDKQQQKKQNRPETNQQELLANIDALIMRVRDVLDQTAQTTPGHDPHPPRHEEEN